MLQSTAVSVKEAQFRAVRSTKRLMYYTSIIPFEVYTHATLSYIIYYIIIFGTRIAGVWLSLNQTLADPKNLTIVDDRSPACT